MHSALVSISGTSEEMIVHIQLIHSFLRKVFGMEHIRFSKQNGEIRIKEAKYPFADEIAKLICSQLAEELQSLSNNELRAV